MESTTRQTSEDTQMTDHLTDPDVEACLDCGHAVDDHDRRAEAGCAPCDAVNGACSTKRRTILEAADAADHGSATITPALARRVLRSARENGDSLTDLDLFACKLAVLLKDDVTRGYARTIARDNGGLVFDADGMAATR
jgi:hypothetical protein